ncbi:hypothetical protein [Erythrobacter sp. CCH5-A1]|jgi:hypothetical protein|uniref:hypothetical protein n=1 Tax=Erythrobacter sp. CCH5-A1 TaxID=1768792 RepID=UPI0008372F9F|nr:hypothetical protein [Erythrobacter sp. CCH5-A1]
MSGNRYAKHEWGFVDYERVNRESSPIDLTQWNFDEDDGVVVINELINDEFDNEAPYTKVHWENDQLMMSLEIPALAAGGPHDIPGWKASLSLQLMNMAEESTEHLADIVAELRTIADELERRSVS